MKKYLDEQANEPVQVILLLTTADAYNEAMILPEQRYGDSFAVANGAVRNSTPERIYHREIDMSCENTQTN